MKKTTVTIAIDRVSYLTLEFAGKIKDLYLFDEMVIAYHKGQKRHILLKKDFVIWGVRHFKEVLQIAIDGRRVLHNSIKHDLGYLWNEYLQEKNGHDFVEKPVENSTRWVGTEYLLFSTPRSFSTWIYNKDSDIYLEITPTYPWHFLEPKKNEKFVSYDEFIKKYKPLMIIKIEKKVARKWLKVLSKLEAIAQKNYEKTVQEEKDRKKAEMENELATKK